MTFKVIENFLPTEDAFKIHQWMTSAAIPWHFSWNAATPTDDSGHGYFSHKAFESNMQDANQSMVYSDGALSLLSNFLSTKGIEYIRMIKFNMYPRTQEIIQHGKHFDVTTFDIDDQFEWSEKGEKTILYYVNDNDGYTEYFPDGKDSIKVPSRFNTALYTDESIIHCSSTCTDKPARLTININFR